MSLNSAIQGAMSGLVAASRGTQLVSENIANAMNEDYARRSLQLGASTIAGPGVKILGVTRHADPVLLAGRRAAEAEFASTSISSDFWNDVQRLVGAPNAEKSLSTFLNQFESAFISAASMPESGPRQDVLGERASDLAQSIRAASEGVQDLRTRADRMISRQVDQLNTALEDVARLNRRIRYTAASGGGGGRVDGSAPGKSGRDQRNRPDQRHRSGRRTDRALFGWRCHSIGRIGGSDWLLFCQPDHAIHDTRQRIAQRADLERNSDCLRVDPPGLAGRLSGGLVRTAR